MESKGRLIMILIAGVVVAFGAIAIYSNMSQEPAPAPTDAKGPGNVRVIVAKHDLTAGTLVQVPQDIDWDTVDAGAIKEDSLKEGSAKLENFSGSVVRHQLHAGDQVPAGALMRSGEGGYMSAVLDPGMRAVSIAVTATSGNGGFISPGDHVDLIVTHHIKDTPSNDSVVSETFVRNVRVVAVDQMLDNPDNKAILAKTVTVEVTSRQAEQISVATEMGKISVALRGIATVDPATGVTVPAQGTTLNGNYTRDTDISSALNRDTVSPHIRIIRGDQTENMQLY